MTGSNDCADGTACVPSPVEAGEHPFLPCAIRLASELVYGTKVICPIIVRCAVEMALTVRSQSAVGKSSFGLAFERVKRGELPDSREVGKLENNALSIHAGYRGHAVQAPFITKQAACRAACAIGPAGEGMDHFQVPSAVLHWDQFENDAQAVHPAGRSHPVESAARAKRHATSRTESVIAPV